MFVLNMKHVAAQGSGNQQVQNPDQGDNFSRRNASMSTGNLADLYNQPGLINNGMQGGLRGVASTSNIWDGQVSTIRFQNVHDLACPSDSPVVRAKAW